MENRSSARGIMTNYGLMLGVALVLLSVISYALGQTYNPNIIFSVLQYIIPFVVIFLGIKAFRALNNESLTLGEAIKTGLGVSLIGGIILAIYMFVFLQFVEPDFFTKMAETVQAKIIESNPNLSDEQIEQTVAMSQKFSNVWVTVASTIMMSLFGGLIYSLICGLILKRNKEA